MENAKPITQLLFEIKSGKRDALDDLLPLVYGELKHLADVYLRRERAEHTLQPTALVHEAYLKLIGQKEIEWQNRAHFFGVAARLMREILVDHARTRGEKSAAVAITKTAFRLTTPFLFIGNKTLTCLNLTRLCKNWRI